MGVPGNVNPLLLVQAAAAGGYTISRSLRFNSADSAYLSRTPASSGNRRTWTWSGWVKRSKLGGSAHVFVAYGAANDNQLLECRFVDDKFWIAAYSYVLRETTQVFRDVSAWGHLVIAVDTTQSVASDRIKLYWNGNQITQFNQTANPSQNDDLAVNQAAVHTIGRDWTNTVTFNGYLADVHFIDGQALDPTSFGEFDATTGVWNPIEYTGSYGTNGFHLDFADNSSAAALGYDAAGSNDWTVNNITASAVNYSNTATQTSTSGYTPSTDPNYYLPNLFDGNTGTYWTIATSGNHNVTATFSPKLPSGTTIEIFGWKNSSNTTGVVEVNGTDVSSLISDNYPGSWADVSSAASGGIQTIKLYRIDGVKNPALTGIRVDGTVLIDVAPASIDSLRDSPTNGDTANDTGLGGELPGNYCTWNPLNGSPSYTYANGNLDLSYDAVNDSHATTTIAVKSGVWYCEGVLTAFGGSTGAGGFCVLDGNLQWNNANANSNGRVEYRLNGAIIYNGSVVTTVATYTVGDVIGIWIDATNNQIKFYKNNTLQYTGSSLTFGSYMPGYYGNAGASRTASATINAGQRAFSYTAPSSAKALCTANLPTPTIEDPSTVMDVVTYTGTGGSQSITSLNYSPDFVWIKERGGTNYHMLFDTVRGANVRLNSNSTNPDYTETTALTSFDSTGFSMGGNIQTNGSSQTYVAWTWDAGSSTVSNTDGSITSSVRANASAGFSIVTYTGNGTAGATVGHGLGVSPTFLIIKRRSTTGNWLVYHGSLANPATKWLGLNLTNAEMNAVSPDNMWNSTAPTSSLVTLGTDGLCNSSGSTYVAYCFAPVAGYSAFGSYTGNGVSGDGVFVYTGMRPRFLLIKRTDAGDTNWVIWDTARETYNPSDDILFPNSSAAEYTGDSSARLDILSNGFKFRNTSFAGMNGSGATYVYAAFAESPFAYSRAR